MEILNQTPRLLLERGNDELGWKLEELTSGQSAGVQQLTVHCGQKQLVVLPTRGMGLWKASNNDVPFGWHSPIAGPVHPAFVPVSEPSGLGWLDGFDEMTVRCGLISNGAPDFDDQGTLTWPLHGRIANLPAHDVAVEMDETAGTISIKGKVNEHRFHFHRLQLETEISLDRESDEIRILDTVTNLSERSQGIQMLYHNNFGSPVLKIGSVFHAPVKKLVPRDAHAASDLENWTVYGEPDSSVAERVYLMEMQADSNGQTTAVLTDPEGKVGVSINYDTNALPYFSLWKNTPAECDGYATGLEPATNFPNPRSFEESNGRVVELAAGQTHTMELSLGLLTSEATVQAAIDRVQELQASVPEIHQQPTDDWCS